jgi:hypothetical protein
MGHITQKNAQVQICPRTTTGLKVSAPCKNTLYGPPLFFFAREGEVQHIQMSQKITRQMLLESTPSITLQEKLDKEQQTSEEWPLMSPLPKCPWDDDIVFYNHNNDAHILSNEWAGDDFYLVDSPVTLVVDYVAQYERDARDASEAPTVVLTSASTESQDIEEISMPSVQIIKKRV